jgi:hypothetical protein
MSVNYYKTVPECKEFFYRGYLLSQVLLNRMPLGHCLLNTSDSL